MDRNGQVPGVCPDSRDARTAWALYNPAVSRKPDWVGRIPDVLAVLRSSQAHIIDRKTVEILLSVSPRHAGRILRRLGAVADGRELIITRKDLIDRLEAISSGHESAYTRLRISQQ